MLLHTKTRHKNKCTSIDSPSETCFASYDEINLALYPYLHFGFVTNWHIHTLFEVPKYVLSSETHTKWPLICKRSCHRAKWTDILDGGALTTHTRGTLGFVVFNVIWGVTRLGHLSQNTLSHKMVACRTKRTEIRESETVLALLWQCHPICQEFAQCH